MMKTFRPFFRPPELELDEPDEPDEVVPDEPDDPHAARIDAKTRMATNGIALLIGTLVIDESFQLWA
jgi:hypothetical protein